jgi:hypothetical protein
MADRARILTRHPEALPADLPFAHAVERIVEGAWDDDEPPDETVVNFTPDLTREIKDVESGNRIEVLLDGPEQLEEPGLADAVDLALSEDRDLTIRIED